MYKIKIISIGKTKESWLSLALDDYTARVKPMAAIHWILAKNDKELKQNLEKESHFIALDPGGASYSTEEWSRWMQKQFMQYGASMNFVIGGPEGLPEEVKKKAASLLSLSRLTFTHQLTRLILLEQLYRIFEIEKGTPYHK